MHQNDFEIIEKSNVQSDALIINQCDKNETREVTGGKYSHRMISTTDRGLSKSRNLAIKNSKGDIGIICDDDEIFYENYQETIINAFKNYPQADIIIFSITNCQNNIPRIYPSHAKKLNFLDCLKVASYEISFRLNKIKENNIWFDEKIGSGISKAGGEENIFLHECLRKGLSIYFIPITIAKLHPSISQWSQHMFSKEYFIDRGIFTKKLIGGKLFAFIYSIYFTIVKYPLYKSKMNMFNAFKYMLYGIIQ